MGASGKDAVCNKHHELITKQKVKKLRYVMIMEKVITKEEVEKLRYVMIIIKL